MLGGTGTGPGGDGTGPGRGTGGGPGGGTGTGSGGGTGTGSGGGTGSGSGSGGTGRSAAMPATYPNPAAGNRVGPGHQARSALWVVVLGIIAAQATVLLDRVGGIDFGGQFSEVVLAVPDIVDRRLLLDGV